MLVEVTAGFAVSTGGVEVVALVEDIGEAGVHVRSAAERAARSRQLQAGFERPTRGTQVAAGDLDVGQGPGAPEDVGVVL